MTGGTGAEDAALERLLAALKLRNYRFVTVSPRTHAIVLERSAKGDALRDLFGWSRAVPREALDADILDLAAAGGALVENDGGAIRSRYRVSSEGPDLYLHSAYPTDAADSVFFGPDSYRFAACIRRFLDQHEKVASLVEIGAGSGVGAITAARIYPHARVSFTDINPAALRLAAINAAAAGVEAKAIQTNGLDAVTEAQDLIVANPPYLVDAGERAYRHGGARYGAQIPLDWAEAALPRLAPGGRFLLYSGAPVVRGNDVLRAGLEDVAKRFGAALDYEETDPDVWGEELARPEYRDVDRIAVACAVITAA